MSFYQQHKKGIIGTVIYHVILLILLILLGFFTPLPLPGEEGILVNFGTSDQGLGDREPGPAGNDQAPEAAEPVSQQEQSTPPPPAQTTPPPATTPSPARNEAMTQNYEETAAIEAAERKRKEDEARKRQETLDQQKRRQEEAERQKQIDAERQRQAEIQRQRQAEIDRQRQAELEKQRQEEAERKRREEEQRKISEIQNRAQGAFGKSGSGSGGEGNSDGKSQGATFPGGNQGVPTGDPNASTYGQGGSGSGNQGSGPSFSLAGRSAKSLPRPNYPGNDEGTVVVKIIVDKNGKVTQAEPGAQGTTIMNRQFWNEARQAALKASFNVDPSAPAFQQGTITYRFVLD